MLFPSGEYASTTIPYGSVSKPGEFFQGFSCFAYLILTPFDQLRLRKVWMKLDLIDRRLDLGSVPYLVDLGDRKVGNTNGPNLALLHQSLHRPPCLDNWDIDDIYAKRLLIDGKTLGVIDAAKGHGPVNL